MIMIPHDSAETVHEHCLPRDRCARKRLAVEKFYCHKVARVSFLYTHSHAHTRTISFCFLGNPFRSHFNNNFRLRNTNDGHVVRFFRYDFAYRFSQTIRCVKFENAILYTHTHTSLCIIVRRPHFTCMEEIITDSKPRLCRRFRILL